MFFTRHSSLFLSLVLVALLTLLSGCPAGKNNDTQTGAAYRKDVLRVGVSATAPPLIFKTNGKITGLEADLAEKLAAYLDKKLEFVEVEWSRQLDYLNEGKTDIIMSGMTITKERQYLVDFTTPYLRSGQIMLIRLEDKFTFPNGITDVMNTNYRIGTVKDTTGDFFVTEAIARANEVTFRTSKEAVEALINHKIDVMIYDAPMVCYYAAIYQSEKLMPVLQMGTEEYLGWAVRKNDTELREKADLFLQTITDNGVLKKEISNWIPYL